MWRKHSCGEGVRELRIQPGRACVDHRKLPSDPKSNPVTVLSTYWAPRKCPSYTVVTCSFTVTGKVGTS